MSQNSIVLPTVGTVSGLVMTGKTNDALDSVATGFAGASAPSEHAAYRPWFDLTNAVKWRRNAADSAYILDGSLAETFVVPRTGNTILGLADHDRTIVGSGTWTQTLTAAATLGDRWQVDYRNDGVGVLTLDPNGSETIDGATTLKLYPGEACKIKCDGSAFKTVGLRAAAIKFGTFTRDMTLATGGVSITGIGFKPRAVFMLASNAAAAASDLSVGFDDGTNHYSVANLNAISAGNWILNTAFSIRMLQGASTEQTFVITSMDDDGFSGTWTKTGSPTGTRTIAYVALR